MLTSDYFMEPNPYTKYAEQDKYYLDQLEEDHTKMTKTRDNSLGNPDKLNYKLLALLVGVFCIHFYVLSLIAQQCFTFFLTTFLLNNAMALQCQHYAYHLIHFLLAHFFTFASKLLFNKVSQLTNRLFTKVYSFAKRKYLRWSSLNIGNLCHLLQKRKIRQLICKDEKTEDKQVLISNYTNKFQKRRKRETILKKNFFEHLQLSAYEKFRSFKNIYQKLTHDHINITSFYYNNIETVNWTMRNFQILTVCEVNYVEVSRTKIYGTSAPLPSPGSSQDQTSSDYVIHDTGANNKERNNSRNPFRKIFDNGLSKKIESKSMNVGAIKNNIAKHLKNRHVLFNKMKKRGVHFQNTIVTNFSRKLRQGEAFLSTEKRKFKWKKRHKEYVVFKIVSQKRMGDENELTFVAEVKNAVKDKPLKLDCECFKYDFAFGDVHEVEDKADWYMRRYERTIGKATEKSIAQKDTLKTLKRQAIGVIGICSPTAYGYRDRVDPNLKPLELDWGKSPKAVLCGCPVTECICDGNKRTPATNIPNAGVIDVNIPRKMVIQLFHELCGCCLDRCLRKIAPAPASTLMPRLSNAVSLRKVFYLEKRSENLPAEMCASKCKHFYFKFEKQGFDDVAVESVHDRADSKNLDKYADDIYHDRTNEVNERVPSTKLSGTRLASGKVLSGKIPSGKIPSGKFPSGRGLDGEVPGDGIDGDKVPSGRVSGQAIDGDKVPSGRVSGEAIDGDKAPSGRVPSGRVPGEGTEGDSPIGDGLVEQEIEGAGETPLYGKDDNIYARGFILTTATQTEFDENGKLLREETDRVKIAFKLRYTTKKDLEGKQINIEICHPCAPVHPPCELTIGSIKQQIFNVKKGIEGTLKTLSGTVTSYTRSWKLGVEEMSEHISSYAKGLQSRVGFGHGEGNDLSDKGTVTQKPSEEGAMEPKYDGDYIEKAKHLTKGHSWPEITPRMRYNERNQTDNLGILAKSENEVLNKLRNHFKNLNKQKTNSCPICSQRSHSADCLTRTKKRHDFFDANEMKSNNIVSPHAIKDPAYTAKQIGAQLSKKIGKCMCYRPESLQWRGENGEEEMKSLPECVCDHSKLSHKGESDKEAIKPLGKRVCHYPKSPPEEGENYKEVIKPSLKRVRHYSKSPSEEGENNKEVIKPLVKCLCHHSKSQEGESEKKVIKPLVKCLCHHSKSQERENIKEITKPIVKCLCHHSKSQEGENDKEITKPIVKCPCHHLKSQEEESDKEIIKPLIKCLCHQSKSQEGENEKEIIKPLVKYPCHHSKSREGENEKKLIKPSVKCLCHHSKSQEEESEKEVIKPLTKCMCHQSKSQEGENDGKVKKPSFKRVCRHPKSSPEEESDTEVMKPLTKCVCRHLESSSEQENGKKIMKPSLSAGKLSSKSINIVASVSVPTIGRFTNKRFPLT